jgi:hypothetical protein
MVLCVLCGLRLAVGERICARRLQIGALARFGWQIDLASRGGDWDVPFLAGFEAVRS